jgi:hypothetical protein
MVGLNLLRRRVLACVCRSNGPFNHGILTTITVPSLPRNCFNFIRFASGKCTDKIVENKTQLYSQLLVDVEVSIAKVERNCRSGGKHSKG